LKFAYFSDLGVGKLILAGLTPPKYLFFGGVVDTGDKF
jgi:hypothetical protein